MRTRDVICIFIVCTALTMTSVPALGAHARPHAHLQVRRVLRIAPADEYFGRLKMSILGIANQLRDLGLRLRYTPQKSAGVLGTARFVEDAMRDWERKYPADPWLPKDVLQLTQLYSRVHTTPGRRSTLRTLHWLLARYGKSRYAAQARAEFLSKMK